MVARLVRDQEVGGSTPPCPTMNYSNAFIPTLREVPADAVIASHRLMFRAGLLRKLANGLFAYLPLGLRSFRKVEQIIREEMNAIGALEIKPTVVIPAELWKESGRWDSMGESMLRVKNRLDNDLVVSPTAEEAFTSIVRDELSSYRQLPLALYQINTKFRDEVRPRYGVMRGREFTMKDAYSWHADEKSLDDTYQAMGRAYRQIFKRCGLSVIPVKADSGAMGGSGSEEFMVPSAVGENEIAVCHACKNAANVETAKCKDESSGTGGGGPPRANPADGGFRAPSSPSETQCSEGTHFFDEGKKMCSSSTPKDNAALEKVATPNVRTIEELCAFFSCEPTRFLKSLIYAYTAPDGKRAHALAVIRGDLEVNEIKLAGHLGASEIALASDEDVQRISGAPPGFAGPVGITGIPIIADLSVRALDGGITGANERDAHYTCVVHDRDWKAAAWTDIRTVREGDACEHCGQPLAIFRGIEVGHIFKLGDKYTKAMGVSYQSESGQALTPIMGCYGIGVDRTLASVIEQHHDDDGIIWPASIAPFDVCIVPINWAHDETRAAAERLAAELEALGLDVLLDDRDARAGFKFKDADLFGIPLRLTIGEKTLAAAEVEWKRRRRSPDAEQGDGGRIALSAAAEFIKKEHAKLLAE